MPHKKNCQCPPCRFRRGESKGQAPRLSVRLDPATRDYLISHKDGARTVIERLVQQEIVAKAASLERSKKATKTANPPVSLSDSRSDDSCPTSVMSLKLPGALEFWAVRFSESLGKNKRLQQLLMGLGLFDQKGRWAIRQLRLGYCSARSQLLEKERRELKKLGMIGPDGREVLADCLTVPYLNPMGEVAGFYGIPLKEHQEDLCTGLGSGFLSTGPMRSPLLLVDGVREALACFGAGVASVQALDLLTPGWFPEFQKRGVAIILAVSERARAESTARELRRLGVSCRWLQAPEEELDRQMLFQDGERLIQELQRAQSL